MIFFHEAKPNFVADRNECKDSPDICRNAGVSNQFCVNTAGSYICTGCAAKSGGTQWPYYGRPGCCTRGEKTFISHCASLYLEVE